MDQSKRIVIVLFLCALIMLSLLSCNRNDDFLGLMTNFGIDFPQDCIVYDSVAQGYGKQHFVVAQLSRSESFADLLDYAEIDLVAEDEIRWIPKMLSSILLQVFNDDELATKAMSLLPSDLSIYLCAKLVPLSGGSSYAYFLTDPCSPNTAFFVQYLH